jgi:hypothetical protein
MATWGLMQHGEYWCDGSQELCKVSFPSTDWYCQVSQWLSLLECCCSVMDDWAGINLGFTWHNKVATTCMVQFFRWKHHDHNPLTSYYSFWTRNILLNSGEHQFVVQILSLAIHIYILLTSLWSLWTFHIQGGFHVANEPSIYCCHICNQPDR